MFLKDVPWAEMFKSNAIVWILVFKCFQFSLKSNSGTFYFKNILTPEQILNLDFLTKMLSLYMKSRSFT